MDGSAVEESWAELGVDADSDAGVDTACWVCSVLCSWVLATSGVKAGVDAGVDAAWLAGVSVDEVVTSACAGAVSCAELGAGAEDEEESAAGDVVSGAAAAVGVASFVTGVLSTEATGEEAKRKRKRMSVMWAAQRPFKSARTCRVGGRAGGCLTLVVAAVSQPNGLGRTNTRPALGSSADLVVGVGDLCKDDKGEEEKGKHAAGAAPHAAAVAYGHVAFGLSRFECVQQGQRCE